MLVLTCEIHINRSLHEKIQIKIATRVEEGRLTLNRMEVRGDRKEKGEKKHEGRNK